MDVAKAIASSPLKAAGYSYVNAKHYLAGAVRTGAIVDCAQSCAWCAKTYVW